MKFKQIMSLVLTVLGIEAFAKNDDGKAFLTDEQTATHTAKYGAKVVTRPVETHTKNWPRTRRMHPMQPR